MCDEAQNDRMARGARYLTGLQDPGQGFYVLSRGRDMTADDLDSDIVCMAHAILTIASGRLKSVVGGIRHMSQKHPVYEGENSPEFTFQALNSRGLDVCHSVWSYILDLGVPLPSFSLMRLLRGAMVLRQPPEATHSAQLVVYWHIFLCTSTASLSLRRLERAIWNAV